MPENQESISTTTPIAPESASEPPIPKSTHPRWPLIILLSILTLFLVTAAYWFGASRQQLTAPTPTPPVLVIQTPSISPLPTEPEPSLSSTGTTWYPTPKAIAALNLFKPALTGSDNYFLPEEAKYYEVGEDKDGTKIINAYLSVNSPVGNDFIRLIQSPAGKISVILPQTDDNWFEQTLQKELDPSVIISHQPIPDLNPPAKINLNNLIFDRYYYSGNQFDPNTSPIKIGDVEFGILYRINNDFPSNPAIYARQIILRLKDNTIVPYILETNLFNDDQSPKITWSDQSYNQNTFTQSFSSGGCGGGLAATTPIIKNISDLNQKVIVGQTNSGQPVYKVIDPNNPIIKSIYSLYQTSFYSDESQPVSITEFSTQPSHYLWQDSLGDWQIYYNQQYIPQAECAKPVIYLYPEKITPVTVQVNAAIRLSDPLYPPGGWQVLARPNGQLDYRGQTYSSLFWEGLGNGPYPDYRDSGTVVSQKDLMPTLTSHLSQLGLNQTESQDFLNFWLDKFPDKPYLRLTWLGTADMERLAPLTVTPQPDTRIRIFLEFEGLDQPLSLKPQNLSAPARRGFTLVEWGGLLTTSR